MSVSEPEIREGDNLIIRTAKVNRSRSQQEAIEATGRTQYTNREVLDNMPKGGGDEVELVFFKPEAWEYTEPNYMNYDDLVKALDRRNLKLADPISVAAHNEADPAFADDKPHCTQWKDAEGNCCCAAFDCWNGERGVNVYTGDDVVWYDDWWVPGVRK